MSHRIFNLTNIFGFQLVWWACILFGNIALPIAFILIAGHIYFHQNSLTELRVILLCGFTGFIVDSVLKLTGVFAFDNQAFYPLSATYLAPPVWLLALWFAFSATIRNSLNYFRNQLALASVLGGISGAGSYIAAERLGAVIFPYGLLNTSIVLVTLWAILFPVLILISERVETANAP